MKKRKLVAIDFDGTCVTHEYPNIGISIGAEAVMRRMIEEGWDIILFTMRSGEHLTAAIKWFNDNGIALFGVNENPEQSTWTQSPKPYAQIYIDDAALGAPLTHSPELSRPFINWEEVDRLFFGELT